jgi:hypothetical protein
MVLNLYRKVSGKLGQLYAVLRDYPTTVHYKPTFDTHCCPSKFACPYLMDWGTRWNSWLRHCATSRKVAGSIPDGFTRIFYSHNPSGRTVSSRNISCEGGGVKETDS